ncbi:MAG TPA: hypothetical protein PKV71_20480 [Calditrichia bacterium]|nr:hypothetical protein [Calditrichota bacterium]HQU74962.1 hypothetical protein [Calditrichia bacterium]HQV34277.1 hypothetical protein [Calditrichia bacterium]
MKRFILILLLLVFGQPYGYLVIFKIEQHQIRRAVKRRIKAGVPNGEQHLIKIPLALEKNGGADFQRVNGHEFRYRGQMFDVLSQERHGEETWYYCISDEQETRLFASLDDQVARRMNLPDNRGRRNLNLKLSLSTQYMGQSQPLPRRIVPVVSGHLLYCFSLKTWQSRPYSPPPEFLS